MLISHTPRILTPTVGDVYFSGISLDTHPSCVCGCQVLAKILGLRIYARIMYVTKKSLNSSSTQQQRWCGVMVACEIVEHLLWRNSYNNSLSIWVRFPAPPVAEIETVVVRVHLCVNFILNFLAVVSMESYH